MKNVLMIDDEADFREVVRRVLEPAGYHVEGLASAEEGLEFLAKAGRQVDLAIIDWNLPGLDGPGLCRRLRQDPKWSRLTLVLLTVRGQPEDQLRGLSEAGVDLYMTKPVQPEEFLARIQSLSSYLGVRP